MKPLPPDYAERLSAAFHSVFHDSPPMTDAERQEHFRLVAGQRARDEAGREQSPQLPLCE